MKEIKDRVKAHRDRAQADGLKRVEISLPETIVATLDTMASERGVKRGELLAKLITEAVTGNKSCPIPETSDEQPPVPIDPLSGKPPRDGTHRQKLAIWRDMAVKLRARGYSIARICEALGDATGWPWKHEQARQLMGELPVTDATD